MVSQHISLPGTLFSLTLALALGFSLAATAQDTAVSDPGSYLPAETTAVLNLRELSVFSDLNENHPVRRFAAHPAFENLIDCWCEELDLTVAAETNETSLSTIMGESLGLEEDEFSRLFPGQFTLAVHIDVIRIMEALKAKIFSQATDEPNISDFIGGVLVADTTADEERLAELLENAANASASSLNTPAEVSVVREKGGDQNLIRLKIKRGDSDAYTVDSAHVDGKFVVSLSPNTDYFHSVLQHLGTETASQGSLADSEVYARARNQLIDPDLFFYVVLEDTMKTIDQAITEAYSQMAEAGPNPVTMMVPEANIRRVLGLTDFKDMTLAAKIQPTGAEYLAEFAMSGRTGLPLKLMEYGESGISLPDFDPTGLKKLQVTSFDFSRMLNTILDYAPQISPMLAGMLDMQLMNLQTQGLDIRGGLIPSLGEGFTVIETYVTPTPDPEQLPSSIWMLGCDDPDGLTAAIEGLKKIVQQSLPLEEKEPRTFMDTTIHGIGGMDFVISQMAPGVTDAVLDYAIVDDQLVITVGEASAMEHAITNLKNGGHDLTEFEALGESWNRWDSENLVAFTYLDVANLVRTLLLGIGEGLDASAEAEEVIAEAEEAIAEADAALAEFEEEGETEAREVPDPAEAEEQAEAEEEEAQPERKIFTDVIAKSLEALSDLSGMRFYLTDKSYQTENSFLSRGFFGEKPE